LPNATVVDALSADVIEEECVRMNCLYVRYLVPPVSVRIVAAMEPIEATARPDESNPIASEY
jgi:hypothetical protein